MGDKAVLGKRPEDSLPTHVPGVSFSRCFFVAICRFFLCIRNQLWYHERRTDLDPGVGFCIL